jgi:N-acetylmuramoyl-L-alanine amidase
MDNPVILSKAKNLLSVFRLSPSYQRRLVSGKTKPLTHLIVFSLCLFALFLSGVSQKAYADNVSLIKQMRLAGDDYRTRLIVTLDRRTPFQTFALADPYRLVLDMDRSRFVLDEMPDTVSRGLVRTYRYGQFAKDKARIVMDLTGPVQLDKAFIAEDEGQPPRLVLDLVSSDRESFLAALPGYRAPAQDKTPSLPALPEDKPVIVLDPGHGGPDGGAQGVNGVKEKHIVLSFANVLKRHLEKTGKFQVVLTRDKDYYISLGKRVKLAREAGASLFLSVHADSLRSHDDVRGASVYTLSERASDEMSRLLAERENRSDILAGINVIEHDNEDVADILLDLTRRETQNLSIRFAEELVDHIAQSTETVRNPHRYASFKVLKAPDVPSVLLELGFLSNAEDEKLLKKPQWRDDVAQVVTRAIEEFFADRVAHLPY